MYQPPKCECGEGLIIEEYGCVYRKKKITKKGSIYKRAFAEYKDYTGVGVENRLRCEECDMEYLIEYDSKARIVRGEEWNSFWDR